MLLTERSVGLNHVANSWYNNIQVSLTFQKVAGYALDAKTITSWGDYTATDAKNINAKRILKVPPVTYTRKNKEEIILNLSRDPRKIGFVNYVKIWTFHSEKCAIDAITERDL